MKMLSRAAKLDAECLPSTVRFACSPTGEKPAEVIVIPVLQTRPGWGAEWSALPWLRACRWGSGPRRGGWMLPAGTGWKQALSLKRKICLEHYK